jgi:hypothetical protein
MGKEKAEIARFIIISCDSEFLRLVFPPFFFGSLRTAMPWPFSIRKSGMSLVKMISWKNAGFWFEERYGMWLRMFS